MIVAVLADEKMKQELLTKKIPDDVTVVWADSLRALTVVMADLPTYTIGEMGKPYCHHLINVICL